MHAPIDKKKFRAIERSINMIVYNNNTHALYKIEETIEKKSAF